MRNQKGIIGLVVIIAVFIAVVISTSTMSQNVSQEDRLKSIDSYITSAEKRIADLESKLSAVELRVLTLEKSKTIASPLASKAVTKSAIVPAVVAGKNQVFHATQGQTVFLNAAGTKFHFWDGCTWFGYGNESTLEEALAGGAVECILCQGHKVIKK